MSFIFTEFEQNEGENEGDHISKCLRDGYTRWQKYPTSQLKGKRQQKKMCMSWLERCPHFRVSFVHTHSFPPGHGEPQQAEDTCKCFSSLCMMPTACCNVSVSTVSGVLILLTAEGSLAAPQHQREIPKEARRQLVRITSEVSALYRVGAWVGGWVKYLLGLSLSITQPHTW